MANDNQNNLEWSTTLQTYKGTTYGLKEALLRSVSYWATKLTANTFLVWNPDKDSMVETWHPLYPTRHELIQSCWVRISAARAAVERIWSAPEPDGFLAVCRYVSRVCTNALIDARRRAKTRAAEIFAQDLDEPVSISSGEDGVNEDSGIFADTLPDSDGLQPFQFEDLRDELTNDEFSVLCKKIDGETQAEIAQKTGESKSEVARTYKRAKTKTRRWVNGLKRQKYHQVRARLCPRFVRNRCTRPDRLHGAELEAWNPANSRTVVAFHDEASQWRPAIKNQPRVRADKECWNLACTHGGAVGPNNLILPSSQSTTDPLCDFTMGRKAESCDFRTIHGVTWEQRYEQPIRFLPAITGEKNRFCEDCEKENKRAEQRVTMRETATFFERETRSNNAIETSNEGKTTMDYKQVAAIIKEFDIPRTTIGRLAGIHLPTLSAYLNGQELTQDKAERIAAWTTDVAKMIQAMAVLGIKADLTDIENVRHLVQKVNDAERQMNLPFDSVLQVLPEALGTSATAN